jgi:hypothetical protein
MRTLYADFNNYDQDGLMPLTCVGSRVSLLLLGSPPVEGERVRLTDGELIIEAELLFDPVRGRWMGRTADRVYMDADEQAVAVAEATTRNMHLGLRDGS